MIVHTSSHESAILVYLLVWILLSLKGNNVQATRAPTSILIVRHALSKLC